MPTAQKLVNYRSLKSRLQKGRSHLLLGNGFSIACDPIFSYPSLYSKAVAAGLSKRAQAVFDQLGTNNFEGVMRLLDDSHWVARIYGLIGNGSSAMLDDVALVKKALIEALTGSHLTHTGMVSDQKKLSAQNFFSDFHNIFTTNYDLLAYWVVMHGPSDPVFHDGFGEDLDDPDTNHVVFFAPSQGSSRHSLPSRGTALIFPRWPGE